MQKDEKKGKNKIGRPVKYKTKEELEAVIDEYFKDCDKKDEPYTVTGLALAVGLSRQGLLEYEGKKEFSDTIKRAKQQIEKSLEIKLIKYTNQTGIIFNLKNNFSWKEKTEIEHTGTIRLEDVL